MAAVASLSFSALSQCSDRKSVISSTRNLAYNSEGLRLRTSFSCNNGGVRASSSSSRMMIHCMSGASCGFFFVPLFDAIELLSFNVATFYQELDWSLILNNFVQELVNFPFISAFLPLWPAMAY